MTPNLIELNYPFDDRLLFEEFDIAVMRELFDSYSDERFDFEVRGWWTTRGLELFPEFQYSNRVAKEFKEKFEVNGLVSPRFYILAENSILRPHIDLRTKCSLNHVLQGSNAEIFFGDGDDIQKYSYKTALLNTSVMHGVINKSEKRILFKLSIFGEDFGQIAEKIDSFKKF